jgi:hypothetical protein
VGTVTLQPTLREEAQQMLVVEDTNYVSSVGKAARLAAQKLAGFSPVLKWPGYGLDHSFTLT